MMPLTAIVGLASSALLAVALVLTLLNVRRRPPATRGLVFALVAGALLLPVDGLILAGYVRGLLGDVSVTTMVIAGAACFAQMTDRDLFDRRNFACAAVLIVAAGLLLYPMALGLTPFDPYALGYDVQGMEVALLVVAIAAWAMDLTLVVACITLAVGGYLLGALESRNLWDYVIDAPITIFCIAWGVAAGIDRLKARRRAAEPAAP